MSISKQKSFVYCLNFSEGFGFDLTLFVETLPLSSGFWASGNNFFLFGFVGGFFFSLGKTWPARGSGDWGRFPLAGRAGRGRRGKAATPRGVTGTGSATSFSVPNGSQRFLPFQNGRSFFLNLLTSRLVTSFLLSLIFRFSFRWSRQSKKRCLIMSVRLWNFKDGGS